MRDIIDSTEAVVLSDDYDNQILDLTWPESITFYDVAQALTTSLGKSVNYVPVPPAAVEQSLRDMNMGDWFPVVMRDYSQAYCQNWGDFTTNDVEQLTGNPARSIESFAREVFAPALTQG